MFGIIAGIGQQALLGDLLGGLVYHGWELRRVLAGVLADHRTGKQMRGQMVRQ